MASKSLYRDHPTSRVRSQNSSLHPDDGYAPTYRPPDSAHLRGHHGSPEVCLKHRDFGGVSSSRLIFKTAASAASSSSAFSASTNASTSTQRSGRLSSASCFRSLWSFVLESELLLERSFIDGFGRCLFRRLDETRRSNTPRPPP